MAARIHQGPIGSRRSAAATAVGAAAAAFGRTEWRFVGVASIRPPSDRHSAAISSGREHTCGIRRNDSAVVCWGSDEYGQASPPEGERFAGSEEYPPKLSGPDRQLQSISSGARHVCGIDNDGTAWCWGDDGYGRSSPPPGEKFARLSSGSEHTCGIRLDGSLLCWGVDDEGQASPPAGSGFVALSSSWKHTCALGEDGTAVCWGGDTGDESANLLGEERFTAISSDWYGFCALRADGSLLCFSHLSFRAQPPSGEAFMAVSLGPSHGCALREDGSPVCWEEGLFLVVAWSSLAASG